MRGRIVLYGVAFIFLYTALVLLPCFLLMIYIDAMRACETVARWAETSCRYSNNAALILATGCCFACVVTGINLADRLYSLLSAATCRSE